MFPLFGKSIDAPVIARVFGCSEHVGDRRIGQQTGTEPCVAVASPRFGLETSLEIQPWLVGRCTCRNIVEPLWNSSGA